MKTKLPYLGLISLGLFSLLFIITSQTIAKPKTLWKENVVAGEFDSSPAIGDVDDDGIQDIIVASTAGRIVALDYQGHTIWWYDSHENISNPPTLADVTGNSNLEVLVVSNSGKIICLNGNKGRLLWTYKLPGEVSYGITALPAIDLDGDGSIEIIAADNLGHLMSLNGEGKLLWRYKHKEGINSAPAVADINGDGKYEIVFSSREYPLECLSNSGKRLWRLNVPYPDKSYSQHYAGTSPIVCDLELDGIPEILVAIRDQLIAISAKGNLLWQYPMKTGIHDGFAAGDLDGDGFAEIVVVDLSGHVACLTSNGEEKWNAKVTERVRRSPTIGDIDGDGQVEILVAGYSGGIDIFTPTGNLKERVPLFKSINTSAAICDLEGNGRLTIICPSEHKVSALSWMDEIPDRKPNIVWPEYRYDSARNGSAHKAVEKKDATIADIDYGDVYSGLNHFCVTVDNPSRKKIRLQLVVEENSQKIAELAYESQAERFEKELPYWLFTEESTDLNFICQLRYKKQILSHHENQIHFIPFVREIKDLASKLDEIKSHFAQNYISSQFEGQTIKIRTDLGEYKRLARDVSVMSATERREFRDKLASARSDAQKILKLVQLKSNSNSSLVVADANPWAPFGGMDEVVESRLGHTQFNIEAFQGESESAAINLYNFRDTPMVVRVEPGSVYSSDSTSTVAAHEVLTFHEVLQVPSEMNLLSADALPELGQAKTLVIAGWDARQLWININTSALTPGTWIAPILLRSLDIDPEEVTYEISIHVWESQLPDKQSLRLCHWGYVNHSVLRDYPKLALEDQVSHGTNVFVATNDYAPEAHFNENGELIGPIDFKMHDGYMRQHAPHGIILFFNYQGKLKGPAESFSQVWKKAYKTWIKAWVEHLSELGVGYEGFAFYPIDEPGLYGGLVDKYIEYAKAIREVDPKIQIYTDPVAGATMTALQRMSPYVDIWCPNRNSFLLDKGADRLAFIKSTGKAVWTYECEGNAKHQSPLGYYRAQAWLAWHHGISGIGFWSYCTSRHDPWYMPIAGRDYLLIYQGNGVVASKRWEAIRDGIEDYSMLKRLEQAISAVSEDSEKKETVRNAKRLLNDGVFDIARFCGLDKDGTVPGVGGIAQQRIVADQRWSKINEVRRKIAELLAELSTK